MMNQSITTQSNMSTCVAESVFFANKVVNQAAVWAGEAAELRAQANKDREEVKTNKKARTIFRIAAPLYGMASDSGCITCAELNWTESRRRLCKDPDGAHDDCGHHPRVEDPLQDKPDAGKGRGIGTVGCGQGQ